VLEDAQGNPYGFRVLLCTKDIFEQVDIPGDLFSWEIMAYLKFRLKVNEHLDFRRLPNQVQNRIRIPLNAYLDTWVEDKLNNGN
jgi:hypothetical protein